MVVDAMDLANSKTHITTFVICSGDSDFSPLVSKLKENDKSVIGVGVKNSTSELLITNCDEFIFYEDLVRETRELPSIENLPEKKRELFRLMLDSIQALQRENYDVIWGSMIKQTMQRKQPYFNETYYGYKSFSELLEDAASAEARVAEEGREERRIHRSPRDAAAPLERPGLRSTRGSSLNGLGGSSRPRLQREPVRSRPPGRTAVACDLEAQEVGGAGEVPDQVSKSAQGAARARDG